MSKILWVYDDGGRAAAGFKGLSGDCAVRAMSIACQVPYIDARALIKRSAKLGLAGNAAISRGVYVVDFSFALETLGWKWQKAPILHGRKAKAANLPPGRFIARMANHYAAVIDGVVYDQWDSSRKMVYGYWAKV